MNKIGLFLLLLFVLEGCSVPTIVWHETYSKYDRNGVTDVEFFEDGSMVIAGFTQRKFESLTSNYNTDIYVFKVDKNGKKRWDRIIGDENRNLARSISITADGGFILSAWDKQTDSVLVATNGGKTYYDDYSIIKLDSLGHNQWDKFIGGNRNDFVKNIFETNDGGYFVAGHSSSTKGRDKLEDRVGGSDYWVLKLDQSKNIQWQRTLGGGRSEHLTSAFGTIDDGFLLAGYSDTKDQADEFPNENNCNDFFVVKLNKKGIPIWYKFLGGYQDDLIHTAIELRDGSILLGGSSTSPTSEHKTSKYFGGTDGWLIKLNPEGKIDWQRSYGNLGDDSIRTLQELSNGDIILGLNYEVYDNLQPHKDFLFIKINPEGETLWQVQIGSPKSDFLFDSFFDGKYIIAAGRTTGFLNNHRKSIKAANDIWVVKYNINNNDVKNKNFDYTLIKK